MKQSILLFATLCFSVVLFAQTKVDYKALDRYVAQAVDQYNMPGLAIAIVKDDKVVFSKSYGLQNTRQKTAVSDGSLFGIASLSKAFTAASIAMLVEEGKLSYDDKVKDILPHFELGDPYISNQMTVRDLLCHRSGLATFDGDLLWYGTNYSRKEIIERIRHRPLSYGHRERFGYQNIMFITAGELIPAVTGKSWDEFVRERIFQPLGMSVSNTSVKDYDSDVNNIAYPHLKGEPIQILNYDNSGGTAAINSCTKDMSEWIRFWLNDGKVNGQQLLDPKYIKTILSSHTNLGVSANDQKNGTHFKSYGMGWFLMDYQGVKVAHHGGGLPGYISKVALVPEENLGVVVLTNDMSGLPSALMYSVIDAHLGIKDGKDWAAESLKSEERYQAWLDKKAAKREADRVADTKPSHKLADYTGTYTDDMYGEAVISMEGDVLKFSMSPTKTLFVSDMEHWHYDTFSVTLKDEFLPKGFITFEFDADGEVTGFSIDLPNPDFHFFKLDFRKG